MRLTRSHFFRVLIAMTTTTAIAACTNDSSSPEPSGAVTIAISQSLTGQTTSAGVFTISGARADSGSTTEELTFGGPLTQSPVPLTFVRTLTGSAGTLTVRGTASLTFSSQTVASLTGTWVVEKGTGRYASTTGSGSIAGAANFGATPPTGTLTYTGRLER